MDTHLASAGFLDYVGDAEYVTSGIIVDTFKAMVEKMFNGAATAKRE